VNPRHIYVFHELDRQSREPGYQVTFSNDPLEQKGINQCDIIQYFTFFECLYKVLKSKLLEIEEIDDNFSDRFFKFIHNPYIQQHELYAVPSTYVNIFELYKEWKEHHLKKLLVPSQQAAFLAHEIPDLYLDEKLYVKDVWEPLKRSMFEERIKNVTLSRADRGMVQFTLKRLFPDDIRQLNILQNHVMNTLSDPDIFVESTKQEFLESMLVDFCYGLYDGDKLAAVCVIVLNRDDKRSLIVDYPDELLKFTGEKLTYVDGITFDTIQVAEEYRGYGIQSFFLSVADMLADMLDVRCIVASVSPKNKHSRDNLVRSGYSLLTTRHIDKGMYAGKERDIMIKLVGEKGEQ